MGNTRLQRLVRLALGVVLTLAFLWLMLRKVDVAEIGRDLATTNPALMGLAFAAFIVGLCCKAERWRLMLLQANPQLSWTDCSGPLVASIAANNVLPFRAGDVMRAFAFNKRLGINASASLTSLFMERLLDVWMVICILGVALVAFGTESSRLLGVGGGVLFLLAAAILLVLLFPNVLRPLAIQCARLVGRLWPSFGATVEQELNKVFATLEYMSQGHVLSRPIYWSGLAWVAEGFAFWFAAMALPSITTPSAAWLAMPLGTLATVIPSTPGYVGTFDYFVAQAMIVGANAPVASTAYAFLVHLVLWIPPAIAGGLYILLNSVFSRPLKRF